MTIKPVFRYDPVWPKVRLFRLVWHVGRVGDGNGYSRKIAFALRPCPLAWHRGTDEWRFVIFGIEVHSRKSWGGYFA